MKREYNKSEDGITVNDNTWMVAGYIKDHTESMDFEDRTGYVDDEDNVHIFLLNPDVHDCIPWFTIKDGELVYNNGSRFISDQFKADNVENMGIDKISEESEGIDKLYDDDMKSDMLSASSKYIPEVKDGDDFLKKLIKMIIIEKDTDVHRYKAIADTPHKISNYIQALQNTTKMNPNVFNDWSFYLGFNFKIIVEDNNGDPKCPLKNRIIYDSETNKITVECEGEEKDEGKVYAVSAKQFSD